MTKISAMSALIALLLVGGCGSNPDSIDGFTERPGGYERIGYSDDETVRGRTFDEDRVREDAQADLAADSYVGVGSPHGCTQDCSGHDAGYRYGSDNDEGEDPGYYGSRSLSFNEGRRAYHEALEERVDQARMDVENDDDEYALEE
jgi:hypothetical protein